MIPTQLTHSVTCRARTHTYTQRSVRVGYMSDPYTQVHDVQLTSDSQLIGQIKNDGLKRNKTKQKDHNSASIKWPLSRSTYQHFLGCWLIDKCCQSHTENKMKQKLQNDSVFSQNFLSPLLQQVNETKTLVRDRCLLHQTCFQSQCDNRPHRANLLRVSVSDPPVFSVSLWKSEVLLMVKSQAKCALVYWLNFMQV